LPPPSELRELDQWVHLSLLKAREVPFCQAVFLAQVDGIDRTIEADQELEMAAH
jgi:hypothetical protein